MGEQFQAEQVRVLLHPSRALEDDNPFAAQLVSSLPTTVTVVRFDWWTAFRGAYDVFHLQWPENLVGSESAWKRVLKRALLRALIIVNRVRGRGMVATVHNLVPHDRRAKAAARLLEYWYGHAGARVYLSEAAREAAGDPAGTVIPHGDYRAFVRAHAGDMLAPVPRRIAMLGQLRPNKGADDLIDAFGQLDLDGYQLVVLGQATAQYAAVLEELASRAHSVVIRTDRRLTDAELARELTSSEIIALPYRDAYNSGAAFMALSFGRPLVVRDSETMRELQREFGPQWVAVADRDFSPQSLRDAILGLESRGVQRDSPPDMSHRSWKAIGRMYASVYKRASTKGTRTTVASR